MSKESVRNSLAMMKVPILALALAAALLATPSSAQARYRDGMNLYQYCRSRTTVARDPLGLWNKDIHQDMTLAMAKAAGLRDAEAAAKWAQQPDDDWDSQPGFWGAAEAVVFWVVGQQDWKVEKMKEWHFPVSKDGVVRPNSASSHAKMDAAIPNCDFEAYFRGLHVLQDSWSHQGKPYTFRNRVGHGRGYSAEERVRTLPSGLVWVDVEYLNWNGTEIAGATGSADDADVYGADALKTAEVTYNMIVRYVEHCPCSFEHKPDKEEKAGWLFRQHWGSGENKVKNPDEVAQGDQDVWTPPDLGNPYTPPPPPVPDQPLHYPQHYSNPGGYGTGMPGSFPFSRGGSMIVY